MNKIILAIDDENEMLAFYRLVLADLADIRTANNMESANNQLEGVDLIILDFFLEDDKELFQSIVPKLRKTAPVLLCSGIQDARVPALGDALGVSGYWNKGEDRSKLRALVSAYLKK